MTFYVYILFSESLDKYYTGFTSDVSKRLEHHNTSKNRFSKKGVPWIFIHSIECPDKSTALALEKKIKSRGAKRYLSDIGV